MQKNIFLIDQLKNVVKILMEARMIYNETLNDYRNVCNSCTIYITFLVIAILIIIAICSVFIYFHQYLKRSNANVTNINANTETVIY